MRVALIHDAVLPVGAYGGTERVIWWLAKFLSQLGTDVVLAAAAGSSDRYGRVVTPDFSRPIEPQLPDVDLYHYFHTPLVAPTRPYVVTIGGNGKPGETFLANTIFVSRNHAERHGATAYVYNGVDPDDYVYRAEKSAPFIFLAKAAWRVKNVRGAIRIARRSGHGLQVLGGSRWWLPRWRGVEWCGMLGGAEKAQRLAAARALLFPVLWHEPFGIAVIEALISGTPVLASPFGSLPELVTPDVGAICASEAEFVEQARAVGRFSAARCREYALAHFSARETARRYAACYVRVLGGERLNARDPVAAAPTVTFRL